MLGKVTLVLLYNAIVSSAWSIDQLLGHGVKPFGSKRLTTQLDFFNETLKYIDGEIKALKEDRQGQAALRNEIKALKGDLLLQQNQTMEIRLRLNNQIIASALIIPPCVGTTLRVTGVTVDQQYAFAPDGVICIGNTASPSPNSNYLVLNKFGSHLHFLGTQSLNKGFIDFTLYVSWHIPTSSRCQKLSNCNKLPDSLRGSISGTTCSDCCSMSKPSGDVYLVCYNSVDSVVDDNGAITGLITYTETLWY